VVADAVRLFDHDAVPDLLQLTLASTDAIVLFLITRVMVGQQLQILERLISYVSAVGPVGLKALLSRSCFGNHLDALTAFRIILFQNLVLIRILLRLFHYHSCLLLLLVILLEILVVASQSAN
jgi:hypothetical protein